MNNSEYVPNDFQYMALEITNLLVAIVQLLFSLCVVVTMWQPSKIVMPMRHICIFHAVLFIPLAFFHTHESFTSLISQRQSGFFCYFRFTSISFFEVMVQWNVLLMIGCSALMVHPSRPFMDVFVSTKYFLMLVLINAVFSGAIVFLTLYTGTAQMTTSCVANVTYSIEIKASTAVLAFLMTVLLCCVRLWSHFRVSVLVSPDRSILKSQNNQLSAASKTLLTYTILFLFFETPRNVANLHMINRYHLTFFWYFFHKIADIIWELNGIILFPICFVRHREIQMNFGSMICFKCMIFNDVFDQEVDDTYRRIALLREVFHDPVRREWLKQSLQSIGNNRLSNVSNLTHSRSQTEEVANKCTSAPDQRPIHSSSEQKETFVRQHSLKSTRHVSFDPKVQSSASVPSVQ